VFVAEQIGGVLALAGVEQKEIEGSDDEREQ
jgi:hypothetical protein